VTVRAAAGRVVRGLDAAAVKPVTQAERGYDRPVLIGGQSAVNAVLLASAVVPVLVVIVGAWIFLRAGARHDERERARTGEAADR